MDENKLDENQPSYFLDAVKKGIEDLEDNILSPKLEKLADTRPICKFNQAGICKFGNNCKFSHQIESVGNSSVFQKEDSSFIIEQQQYECGICLESILIKNEKFGILNNCECKFCLSCIRGWRSDGLQIADSSDVR